MRKILALAVALLSLSLVMAQTTIERPYAVGADISWLQSQEDHGTKFSDGHLDEMEITWEKVVKELTR